MLRDPSLNKNGVMQYQHGCYLSRVCIPADVSLKDNIPSCGPGGNIISVVSVNFYDLASAPVTSYLLLWRLLQVITADFIRLPNTS